MVTVRSDYDSEAKFTRFPNTVMDSQLEHHPLRNLPRNLCSDIDSLEKHRSSSHTPDQSAGKTPDKGIRNGRPSWKRKGGQVTMIVSSTLMQLLPGGTWLG